jgi:hypothetical protein
VISASVAYIAWAGYVRFICEPVQTNTLVGRSEGQIRGSYGRPDEDWQGYHSLALYVPSALPPGPIRTLIFHPCSLLHPEGGTLWVWVTERWQVGVLRVVLVRGRSSVLSRTRRRTALMANRVE